MAAEELARAKVNLFLHVTGRRADGYHLLESMVVFPALGDRLEAEPSARLSLTIDGPFAAALGAGADNLVIRAAAALSAGRGAALKLTKSLPVAAGIGGGSADAGAALRLLTRLWGESADAAAAAAPALGADVPMCLGQQPALVFGAGEMLTPAPGFPGFAIVLANPMRPLATAEVFAALETRANPPAPAVPERFASLADLADWLRALRNDLEGPALARLPVIGGMLAAIAGTDGCRLTRMSGSGATCFGLYDDLDAARRAADDLRAAEPAWWVAAAPVEGWRQE